MLGIVTSPQVSVERDGHIAYLFNVTEQLQADPYFVVYVLLPNGQQDMSAPSSGRISVVIPRVTGLDFTALRWLSGSPELTIAGATRSNAFTIGNPGPPVKLMLWRANLADGTVGTPEYSGAGLGSDFLLEGFTLGGNGVLWGFGAEDNYIYGSVGVAPLTGIGRGVLLPYDVKAFATTTPTRIVASFSGRYSETFSEAKLLSNGGLLVLGSYNPERQQYSAAALTRLPRTVSSILATQMAPGALFSAVAMERPTVSCSSSIKRRSSITFPLHSLSTTQGGTRCPLNWKHSKLISFGPSNRCVEARRHESPRLICPPQPKPEPRPGFRSRILRIYWAYPLVRFKTESRVAVSPRKRPKLCSRLRLRIPRSS